MTGRNQGATRKSTLSLSIARAYCREKYRIATVVRRNDQRKWIQLLRSPAMRKASTPGSLGLISRGDRAGGFTITGEDGRVWELNSKKVHLADHVGPTVTVTGTAGKTSKAQEEKIEAHEKKKV